MKKAAIRILFCLPFLTTIALAVAFFGQRYISLASLAPAAGCFIMALQCLIYHNANPNEVGYHPGLSVSNDEVARRKNKYLAKIIAWFIPFQVLLILFAHDIVKIAGAISLLVLPLLVLPIKTALKRY